MMYTDPTTPEPARSQPKPYIGVVIGLAVLGAMLVVPFVARWTTHNSLVAKQDAVDAAWAQVESAAQRRADLIPNLVRTVDRYLEHERATLSEVAARRAGALTSRLAAAYAAYGEAESAADIATMITLHENIGQDIMSLIAVAEDYPSLRSADQFLQLQAQLEGAENRLNIARVRYNEAVREHNSAIRGYLATTLGLSEGMMPRQYFKAKAEAMNPVAVTFAQ